MLDIKVHVLHTCRRLLMVIAIDFSLIGDSASIQPIFSLQKDLPVVPKDALQNQISYQLLLDHFLPL